VDRTERGFAASPEQVRAARYFTDAVMARWGLETTDVVLVVGELAANAVRHAHSAFTLSLYLLDDTVTVEVTDSSPATALMVRAPWNSTSGRGLMIVDKLAKLWGSRPAGCGKTVWAEIQVR
jgi:anti-sigma regulatory factor (Ser/Thr protein kinase)